MRGSPLPIPAATLYLAALGSDEWHGLLDRTEEVAIEAGDDYHLTIARARRGGREESSRVRELASSRGDHFLTTRAAVFVALCVTEDDPAEADSALAAAEALVDANGNCYLREKLLIVKAMAARCNGDLRRCIEMGREVLGECISSRDRRHREPDELCRPSGP